MSYLEEEEAVTYSDIKGIIISPSFSEYNVSLTLGLKVNVMVDDALRAVIVDFVLVVYTNAYSTKFVSCRDGHVRWRPPEEVKLDRARAASAQATPEMDMW